MAFPRLLPRPGKDVQRRASQDGRGGRTMFLDTFRAMERRPASLESHCSRGKRPGLIGMSGAMVSKNMVRPPRPSWDALLWTSLPGLGSSRGKAMGELNRFCVWPGGSTRHPLCLLSSFLEHIPSHIYENQYPGRSQGRK